MGPYGPRRGVGVWVVLGISLALIAVVAFLVIWQWESYSSAPDHRYFFWPFGGILLVLLVVWVAFFVVRIAWWSSRSRRWQGRPLGGPYQGRAVMIARQRYARGEITREQYDQIMRDLGRGPGSQ